MKNIFSYGLNYDFQFQFHSLNLDTLYGMQEGGRFKTNGIAFAHSFGLSLSTPITNKLQLFFNPNFVLANLSLDTVSNTYKREIDIY